MKQSDTAINEAAIGVECAWPATRPPGFTAETEGVRARRGSGARRRVVAAVLVSVVLVSTLVLAVVSSDLASSFPAAMPLHGD